MIAVHDNSGENERRKKVSPYLYIHAQLGISVGRDTTGEGYAYVV